MERKDESMYYLKTLATAKEGAQQDGGPHLLYTLSNQRVVKDRVVVAPVKDSYEAIFKASQRLMAGESLVDVKNLKELSTPA